MKKNLSLLLALFMLFGMVSFAFAADEKPLSIRLYYPDNATLPFKKTWPAIVELEKKYNVELNFEPIPSKDYTTKASLALSTGENVPDVMLYLSTGGTYASLALNGTMLPVSQYQELTPHFNERIKEMGLEEELKLRYLSDGNLYYLPGLKDKPFYDSGIILRQDFLEKKGFEAPKTFDDLYKILKAYKEENPDSFPLTSVAALRVIQRQVMPSFGISVGRNASTGTGVLSWDYEKKEYFPAAISQNYKDYISYMAKLHKEGLLDPELEQDDASTAKKLATGKAMAVYGWYDQMGGWEAASEIPGIKFKLFAPLEGTAGRFAQPRSQTEGGVIFPIQVKNRPDFEQVVRKIDEVFYSEEAAKIWCLGVEGDSYTMADGKVKYNDTILNAKEGVYKYMQNAYGTGCGGLQLVWYLEREFTKYGEDYAEVNREVVDLKAIQPVIPVPNFDDITAEDAALTRTRLLDAFNLWDDEFRTGKKDVEKDWDAYVQDMKDKGIEQFTELYNKFKR